MNERTIKQTNLARACDFYCVLSKCWNWRLLVKKYIPLVSQPMESIPYSLAASKVASIHLLEIMRSTLTLMKYSHDIGVMFQESL